MTCASSHRTNRANARANRGQLSSPWRDHRKPGKKLTLLAMQGKKKQFSCPSSICHRVLHYHQKSCKKVVISRKKKFFRCPSSTSSSLPSPLVARTGGCIAWWPLVHVSFSTRTHANRSRQLASQRSKTSRVESSPLWHLAQLISTTHTHTHTNNQTNPKKKNRERDHGNTAKQATLLLVVGTNRPSRNISRNPPAENVTLPRRLLKFTAKN